MTVSFLMINAVTKRRLLDDCYITGTFLSEFCVVGTLISLFTGVSFMIYLMACSGLAHLTTLVVNEERVPSDLFKLEQLSPSAG